MSARLSIHAMVFLAAVGPPALLAVETGDFDGDGRLSIRDMALLEALEQPAPGSIDAHAEYFCFDPTEPVSEWNRWDSMKNVYIESLRRGVEGSLPHWLPIPDHRVTQPPLPRDPRVVVRIAEATAPGGDSDAVELRLTLDALDMVTHFSLILESEGQVLRILTPANAGNHPGWQEPWGGGLTTYHTRGDMPLGVSAGHHLITGGRLVIGRGFLSFIVDQEPLPPGSYTLIVDARLARGTRGGRYALRLHPASEALLQDSTLLSPEVEGDGAITVERDVAAGWDEWPLPIQVDPERREVLGKIEFRLTDAAGNPGEVVAEGRPGDLIAVRAQVRTEVPLNSLICSLDWPQDKLHCQFNSFSPDYEGPSQTNLFVSPEDGALYSSADFNGFCSTNQSVATFRYQLAGFANGAARRDFPYPDRLFEYFQPLGEWRDLFELRLRISARAVPGEEIPIELPLPHPCGPIGPPGTAAYYSASAEYIPYAKEWWFSCATETATARVACTWGYPGLAATGGKVRVLDAPPPPPPPDYGIEIEIGDASGNPGELVDLPVFVAASEPLNRLRLALALDPSVAVVESIDVSTTSAITGEPRIETVSRSGSFEVFQDCVDFDADGKPERCELSQPVYGWFHRTEERFVLLDIEGGSESYPGTTMTQVATLRARIQEAPGLPGTALEPADVRYEDGSFVSVGITGGEIFPADPTAGFSPARGFRGGTITVDGWVEREFLRGDANADSRVDLSDAVAILGYLFAGGFTPPCLDAADADDSGRLEISDPIFLLGALFLGNRVVPAPHPECGVDPTADGLGCAAACEGGGA